MAGPGARGLRPSFAQAAIARLEEIRLGAVELRTNTDLGAAHELVAELEHSRAPLRERLRRYLMTVYQWAGGRTRWTPTPERAQGPRRRARDRTEPGTPGAGASDPSPGSVAGCRSDCSRTSARGCGAVDSRHCHAGHAQVDALAVAGHLCDTRLGVLILARLVSDAAELGSASAWLDVARFALAARGVVFPNGIVGVDGPG